MTPMLDGKEVARHNSRESCWIAVLGKVYDVTGELPLENHGQRHV